MSESQTTHWICEGCGQLGGAYHACKPEEAERYQAAKELARERQAFLDDAAKRLMDIRYNDRCWFETSATDAYDRAEALWAERMKRYG